MPDILLDPTTTNHRHQEPDTVYHIYNRIAHSVRFLEDEEKDDLLDRLRRVAEFSGIRLLAWGLMTNHFHTLVYLPERRELSRDEIKRRFALLKPEERAVFFDGFILDRAPRELTKRMYNIGMFMKIVKENFTIAYNERTAHHGTMWEGPYCFKPVPMAVKHLAKVAAYQNLNPIRACMTADYAGYAWTSFAAASKGDRLALDGIDFVFGGYEHRNDDLSSEAAPSDAADRTVLSDTPVRTSLSDTPVRSDAELIALMRAQMDRDLEEYKRERAEAVWRSRLANLSHVQADPLTSEAMVEQVAARMARLQSDDFHAELAKLLGRAAKEDEVKVVRAMVADPEAKTENLAQVAGVSKSRVKRISSLLQKLGIVRREGSSRRGIWRLRLFDGVEA